MTMKIGPAATVLCTSQPRVLIDHLVEKLSFRLDNSVGEGPSWASLYFGPCEFMVLGGDHPAPAADWCAYIYVEGEIDALYRSCVESGADLKGPPVLKPYNNREFEARLPDGRVIVFGGIGQ